MAPVTAESLNDLSAKIIGPAVRVHRELGPGLLESAYTGCLCYELHVAGLSFEVQRPIPLRSKEVAIDCAYRADLIVESGVILEVKALESLAPIHARQLLTYLRLASCPLGLILNFGAPTLRAGIKRVVNGFPQSKIDQEPPRSLRTPR